LSENLPNEFHQRFKQGNFSLKENRENAKMEMFKIVTAINVLNRCMLSEKLKLEVTVYRIVKYIYFRIF
jgi:hypothetical protein